VTHRFKRLVRLAGVPEVNLHYTRHAYAGIALAAGATLPAVSEILGHADPLTSARIYHHVEAAQHIAVARGVVGAIMSHLGADVTSDVTYKDDPTGNAGLATGVPLGISVRPEGLEPPTLRSGISLGASHGR
jgi:hypothetical protein